MSMSPLLKGLAEMIRDGLFLAASRTYGEQYIEPFIRAQYGLEVSPSDHDGIDPRTRKRYEIKAAKVLTGRVDAKKASLLQRILAEINNTQLHRMVAYADRYTAEYDANIQNVKRDHFDFLIYVLLFRDRVVVFEVRTDAITLADIPNWSDKHGRYDKLGKSGQFNIKKHNIERHESKYQKDVFTYEQLKERFEAL